MSSQGSTLVPLLSDCLRSPIGERLVSGAPEERGQDWNQQQRRAPDGESPPRVPPPGPPQPWLQVLLRSGWWSLRKGHLLLTRGAGGSCRGHSRGRPLCPRETALSPEPRGGLPTLPPASPPHPASLLKNEDKNAHPGGVVRLGLDNSGARAYVTQKAPPGCVV